MFCLSAIHTPYSVRGSTLNTLIMMDNRQSETPTGNNMEWSEFIAEFKLKRELLLFCPYYLEQMRNMNADGEKRKEHTGRVQIFLEVSVVWSFLFQIMNPLQTPPLSPPILVSKVTTIAVAVVTVIHWRKRG